MPPVNLGPPPRFFTFDFSQWPGALRRRPPGIPPDKAPQEDRKPFDPLMPFHRIRVPDKQIIPTQPVAAQKVITGDGYGAGARSTHDYDGKFGEDLGKELAELVEKILPPLQLANLVAKGVSRVLGFLIRPIPGLGKVADFLDNVDPLRDLFGAIGNLIDSVFIESTVRSVPAWVPTFDEDKASDKQLQEIDGILIRSHQRYDALPFWQWHRWYDWRFAVAPSPLFSELVGFGNTHRDDDNKLGDPGEERKNYNKEGLPPGVISADAIAECEWDLGVIGVRERQRKKANGDPYPSDRFPLFFDELSPRKPHDWCWPMAGMFFWAIGRSVYDGTRATANDGRRTPKAQREAIPGSSLSEAQRLSRGVHINQLHPLKAIATARWEAFKFKENQQHVPAIQFMFYGNTHLSSGGFFGKENPVRSGFPPLNDQDYEFVIDLPVPPDVEKPEYSIGHTPEFALNTLVLRPRLLIDANFEPFMTGGFEGGVVDDAKTRESNQLLMQRGPKPIVELFGLEPGKPPRQAKITIPLKSMSDNNAYGVLLSLGWADPTASLAKQVKKVTVRLVAVQPADPSLHETGDGEWNMNVGVNGRWFQFRFEVLNKDLINLDKVAGGPVEIVMHLATNDFVMVSVHGCEEDGADDLLRLPPEFPGGQERPPKEAPTLEQPNGPLDSADKIIKFKTDTLKRMGTLFKDRLLRHAASVTAPSAAPTLEQPVPPTVTVSIPMVGREVEWNDTKNANGEEVKADIDTDDNHAASLTARAIFLRLALSNLFEANSPLGLIDAKVPDPARASPDRNINPLRSQDSTDSPNPLVVQDILNEVGPGVFKKCQLSAYHTTLVGRMHTLAYHPNKLDYTFFYEVKVEDLPAN